MNLYLELDGIKLIFCKSASKNMFSLKKFASSLSASMVDWDNTRSKINDKRTTTISVKGTHEFGNIMVPMEQSKK